MIRSLIVIVPRIALALAFPLFTAPSSAQSGDPAGPHAANDADRLFVQRAAIGGKAEVELGRIAESRGARERIQAFGRRMATDHGEANARLAAIARDARLPVPDTLDGDHRAMIDDLGRRSGGDFDAAYARGRVACHERAMRLLEWEIGAGRNEALKTYAKQALPLARDHLERAQRLLADVGAAGSGGAETR